MDAARIAKVLGVVERLVAKFSLSGVPRSHQRFSISVSKSSKTCMRAGNAPAFFDAAVFARTEMRSCDLTDLGGVERLTGVRIGVPELMQIAAQLANAHGIAVV